MPMIDYVCPDCDGTVEEFHQSSIPEQIGCECGGTMTRSQDPLLTLRRPSSHAQNFPPIAIDRQWVNGEWKYSYPGANDAPPEPGYERIFLRNMRESDRFSREVSGKEQELRAMNIEGERRVWDERTKMRREHIQNIIRQRGFSGKYFDAACRFVDAAREKRYAELGRSRTEVINQALNFNAGNRQAHCDIRTGWKDRK